MNLTNEPTVQGPQPTWPSVIWIARHGESSGNLARREAEAAGHAIIEIATRDIDVPLSELGTRQARALGSWFGRMPAEEQPTVVFASPYLRAEQTAALAIDEAGIGRSNITFVIDERLREKEFGILDRLTHYGIQQRFPEQWEYRQAIGKFYHRPPGGESWCDVLLRLRSLIDTITRDCRGQRVLIVCHQVVLLCFRYLFEQLTEEQVLTIDRTDSVANCSVTSYEFEPAPGPTGKLALRLCNFVSPLETAGEPVTLAPDVPVAPK